MSDKPRKISRLKRDTLVAVRCVTNEDSKRPTISFCYDDGRWTVNESFEPKSVRDALGEAIPRIRQSARGVVARFAKLDEQKYQNSARRARRYIAKSPERLYPNTPNRRKEAEPIGYGFYVRTHLSWKGALRLLQRICEVASVRFEKV